MRRLPLLFLAAVLLLSGCDSATGSRSPARPPGIQDLAKAPVDLTKGCPKPQEHLPQIASGKLPTGAVLVRLCSGWQPPAEDLGGGTPLLYPPVDALTQDPDRLVRLVNSLPIQPAPKYCALMGGAAIDLWFGYPDGRAAVGHREAGGCTGMKFGGPGGGVTGTLGLLRTFVRDLDEQRRQTGARTDLPAPGCSPWMQPGMGYGYRTGPPWTSATYCVRDGRGPWRQARIPQSVLRMINQQASTPAPDRDCSSGRLVVILARTIYGDLAHVVGSPCEFRTYTALDSRETDVIWRPSPTLRRALERLPLRLARHQLPPPSPSATVNPQ